LRVDGPHRAPDFSGCLAVRAGATGAERSVYCHAAELDHSEVRILDYREETGHVEAILLEEYGTT
jgi:hypothetical protein